MTPTQEKIRAGKQLLSERRFPDEIIESIAEKRLRKNIRKEIFKYDVHFDQINAAEKKRRAKILRIQLAHTKYLAAKDKFIPVAAVLIFIGFITVVTATVEMNDNLAFGIASILSGASLYVLNMNSTFVFSNLKPLVLIFGAAILLEFIVFGWPQRYLEFIYNYNAQELATTASVTTRGSAIVVIINESSPFAYLIAKVTCFFLILNIQLTQQRFRDAKEIFEQSI